MGDEHMSLPQSIEQTNSWDVDWQGILRPRDRAVFDAYVRKSLGLGDDVALGKTKIFLPNAGMIRVSVAARRADGLVYSIVFHLKASEADQPLPASLELDPDATRFYRGDGLDSGEQLDLYGV